MIPYNSKIYTVHPKEYASHWCNHYIPIPTIEEIIEGAVTSPKQKKIGYNATFKYPKTGGIGELPKRLLEQTETEVLVNGVEIDVLESIIGEIPKKRSFFRRMIKRIIKFQFTAAKHI
jgi:hypothetical protein